MITKIPVSVFIIALNEGDRIAKSIESVRGFADEIIVIDSGSNDNTAVASTAAGARVVHQPDWKGYGLQKRFGEDQCRNDWLLNIDADEVVSPELAEEICAMFATDFGRPLHPGWEVKIAEILPGQKKPGLFSHRVYAIRFYDKKHARFSESAVHDSVLMDKGATVGKLNGLIDHRSSRGLSHTIDKVNRYSSMQAEDMARRNGGAMFPMLRLIVEMPTGFFKAYILRGYILQGRQGFVNAMIYGMGRFIRLAKFLAIRDEAQK